MKNNNPEKVNPESVKVYIGMIVRNKRTEKGLTQQDLCDLIGMKYRPDMSLIENGKGQQSIEWLMKICVALEMEPCELFPDLEWIQDNVGKKVKIVEIE